jgi:hypothetical protein
MTLPRVILVTGMHRSGTSAVAGALSFWSVGFGRTLLPARADNERGFFENERIYRFHLSLLERRGLAWYEPFPPPVEGKADPVELEELARILRDEFAGAEIVAVKDPRITRFLPLWRETLAALGWTPVVVLPVRHPLEVAASLARRDNFSLEMGALLWHAHNLEAERLTRDLPRIVLGYADLLEDAPRQLRRLSDQLGIPRPRDEAAALERIASFLEPTLRHHVHAEKAGGVGLPREVFAVHDCLANLAREGADEDSLRHELDRLGADFHRRRGLFHHREVLDLRARESSARDQLTRLTGSRSWRLTAPARRIMSWWRGQAGVEER